MKKQHMMIAAVFAILAACNNNPSAESTSPPPPGDSQALPSVTPITDPADSVVVNTANVDSSGVAQEHVDKNEKKYSNDKGETITAVYHDSGNMGVAALKINGEDIKLMKGEKEKGATTYTNGKLTWKVKDGEATLEKDNVVTVYKEVK
ncbi:MliC family protein [Niabella beijingensis]|uniref:MliC family protein n=1 Tax=Niabella beijingensis TaxID=2872700 RepID=UPI001CBF93E5|nr:MliC family protein [Niabella beijingensis]MBZ4189581.1 MliC family protein [Niabella beijingensis]